MRLLLVLSLCFCIANSIALGQQANPSRSLAPAPQSQTSPQVTLPTPPQPYPEAPYNNNELESPPADDLSLDSNQSYDFDDADSSQFASTSDSQSSIASNSEFRGASPQMMGDFGGGSTILNIGTILSSNQDPLTVQIPFAGGSRRIKAGENNQVEPLNRVYGTFNYFDGALVSGGDGGRVQSNGLTQYTMGIEKTFLENYSIDVRMPLIGAIDYTARSSGPSAADSRSSANIQASGVGNLSTSIKALLLQMDQISISCGLQLSIPTGSDSTIAVQSFNNGNLTETATVFMDNDALHLMPFIGAYREIGDFWWLQAFTQVDVPTRGNDVRVVGNFVNTEGRLNEQTLLYADVSLGTWLYRKPSNCCRHRQRGITGIASILELHYTSSLNDADTFFTDDTPDNRFDVLNLTMGMQVDFSERWRINVSGVVPLREREFEADGARREDRFFDGELSLQLNRFF